MSMLTTKRNNRMLESSKVDRKTSENKVDIEAVEWHDHKKDYEIVQEMLL